MAVGDVKSNLVSVASNDVLTIQPPVGEEWIIHNIYHESNIELRLTDGTNTLTFDSTTGRGVYARFSFHVTNTLYLQIVNVDTVSRLIGYDGVQSK